MSKNKKSDILLEEKIERIRIQNEKIKQRHLEVEADKQEAEKLNAMVNVKEATEDWTCHRTMETLHQDLNKQHRKSDNDGNIKTPNESVPKMETCRKSDLEMVMEMMKQKRQGQDEQWRKERKQIDEERINRQKTPDGRWRREWDEEKLTKGYATAGSRRQKNPYHFTGPALGPKRLDLEPILGRPEAQRSIDPSDAQGRPIVKTMPPAGSYKEAQHAKMPKQKSSSKTQAPIGEVSVSKAMTPQQRIKIELKKINPLEVITNEKNDIRITHLPQDIYNKEPKAQRNVLRNLPAVPDVLEMDLNSDDSDEWEDLLSGDEKQSPVDLHNTSFEMGLRRKFSNFKITVDVKTNVRALSEISQDDEEEFYNVKMPIQKIADEEEINVLIVNGSRLKLY